MREREGGREKGREEGRKGEREESEIMITVLTNKNRVNSIVLFNYV